MVHKFLIFIIVVITLGITLTLLTPKTKLYLDINSKRPVSKISKEIELKKTSPLQIEQMRKYPYAGSELTIEKNLGINSNYTQYIASYISDGLKIYGLLTIPTGETPKNGWPVIIFNHGYIPPDQYKTTERYVAYVDTFARNGYIVFKSDYRGHGNSEGNPEGAYYSPAYTIDVLNAVETLKKYKGVNPEKIGMWGHSMGGNITLRSMVITKDIKVGVIWGGVVASYEDMATKWRRTNTWRPSTRESSPTRPTRDKLIKDFGTFEQNTEFWRSISPIYWVKDISGQIQLHHGTSDEEVPWEFSESLEKALKEANKEVEFYKYENGDHNISSPNFEVAIDRSVKFFDKYLK